MQTHPYSTNAYCFNIQKTWTYPFLWIYKATNQIVRMSWLPVYRKHHVIEFIPFLSPVSYQNAQSCFPCYKNAFVHNTDESVFYTKLVHILTYSLETGKVYFITSTNGSDQKGGLHKDMFDTSYEKALYICHCIS